jgi:hypothetical protein
MICGALKNASIAQGPLPPAHISPSLRDGETIAKSLVFATVIVYNDTPISEFSVFKEGSSHAGLRI